MGYNSIADIIGLFSRCCLPKSQIHAKFRQNLTLEQFKVIQGHRSMVSIESHAPEPCRTCRTSPTQILGRVGRLCICPTRIS